MAHHCAGAALTFLLQSPQLDPGVQEFSWKLYSRVCNYCTQIYVASVHNIIYIVCFCCIRADRCEGECVPRHVAVSAVWPRRAVCIHWCLWSSQVAPVISGAVLSNILNLFVFFNPSCPRQTEIPLFHNFVLYSVRTVEIKYVINSIPGA